MKKFISTVAAAILLTCGILSAAKMTTITVKVDPSTFKTPNILGVTACSGQGVVSSKFFAAEKYIYVNQKNWLKYYGYAYVLKEKKLVFKIPQGTKWVQLKGRAWLPKANNIWVTHYINNGKAVNAPTMTFVIKELTKGKFVFVKE